MFLQGQGHVSESDDRKSEEILTEILFMAMASLEALLRLHPREKTFKFDKKKFKPTLSTNSDWKLSSSEVEMKTKLSLT